MPKTSTKTKRTTNFVRITLDNTLLEMISKTKQELPLLDSVEIIKTLISRGYKANTSTSKPTPVQILEEYHREHGTLKLPPEYNFQESYKEVYHQKLDQKYDR